MNTVTAIPNETAKKRALAESLEKIRVAESFPVKGDGISRGQKRQDWARPVATRNHSLKK